MNAPLFCLVTCAVLATSAIADGLYRSDVTYVSDKDRQAEVEKLITIETPSEQQYLTQIALEKPDIFVRQIRRAREILHIGGEPSQISSKLRAEGFYSPDTQSALQAFVLSLHPDDVINRSHAMNFVMRVNNPTDVWIHLLDATGKPRRLCCVGVRTKSGANRASRSTRASICDASRASEYGVIVMAL